jgi:hypothetical protein
VVCIEGSRIEVGLRAHEVERLSIYFPMDMTKGNEILSLKRTYIYDTSLSHETFAAFFFCSFSIAIRYSHQVNIGRSWYSTQKYLPASALPSVGPFPQSFLLSSLTLQAIELTLV